MTTIATDIPSSFVAGDSVKWTRSLTSYLPTDGWGLSYQFALGEENFTITGANNGDGSHLMSQVSADTQSIQPGVYQYQAYVTKGADRHTIDSGEITVKPNFSLGADSRSDAQKMLDAVNKVLLGELPKSAVASYSIAGRSLSKLSLSELMDVRDRIRADLARERKAAKLAAGIGSPNRVQLRMRG
ncbi:MAG: hypothetical protein AAF542_17875 [Pseudomonadota bacterium]